MWCATFTTVNAMCKKKNKHGDDDGRRIADMSSLADMTYVSNQWFVKKHNDITAKKEDLPEAQNTSDSPPFTKKETRAFVFYSLRMTLIIASVFIAAFAIFILFCLLVWFK